MSTYVMHHGAHSYGVRETTEDLLVFAAADASASSAAYLVAFLNAHARHVPAHRVRSLLVGLGSELPAIPAPRRAPEPERADERSA